MLLLSVKKHKFASSSHVVPQVIILILNECLFHTVDFLHNIRGAFVQIAKESIKGGRDLKRKWFWRRERTSE